MLILGLETSCDETAAALLKDGVLLADRTTRQVIHEEFGGVVPEIASRSHERLLAAAVEQVMNETGITAGDVDLVAATAGPGLAGALLVGVSFAKGFAVSTGAEWLGVNHLEGHIWSAELTGEALPTPFLALLVSGGHTLLVEVREFGVYRRWGGTRDDAVGELFDKTGRMMGFPFPAGEAMDREALRFSGEAVKLPRAKITDNRCDLSFSGLKTAVLYHLKRNYSGGPHSFDLPEDDRAALCAGIMAAVADMLSTAVVNGLEQVDVRALVVAGGVSSSGYLRRRLERVASEAGLPLFIPPLQHCTDNAAMIAYAGYRRRLLGEGSPLDLEVDPAATLFTLTS